MSITPQLQKRIYTYLAVYASWARDIFFCVATWLKHKKYNLFSMYIQYNWYKHSIHVSLSNWLNMLIFAFLAILDFISHVPRGKELNSSHPFAKTIKKIF